MCVCECSNIDEYMIRILRLVFSKCGWHVQPGLHILVEPGFCCLQVSEHTRTETH